MMTLLVSHVELFSKQVPKFCDFSMNASFNGFYFVTEALLINHIRGNHLSANIDVTPEEYEKVSEDFGDHIIEYNAEENPTIKTIHSIL